MAESNEMPLGCPRPHRRGSREPIRRVKRLSTTTQLRPGEQVSVAEVDLSGWGGKGVLRPWIRFEWGRRDQALRVVH